MYRDYEIKENNNDISFIENDPNNMFDIYVVEKGDSIYSISNKFKVPYKELILLNGLNENDYIYPNQQLLVPKVNTKFYITKENDTIDNICSYLGINSYDILSKNGNLILEKDQMIIY